MNEEIREVMLNNGVTLVPIPELKNHADEDVYKNYFADLENGRIWSNVSRKFMNPKPNRRFGYCYTSIKGNAYSVHSLIMSAAYGTPKSFWLDQGLEVDHINGKKDDNSIDNLRLRSRQQQYDDRVRELLGKGKRFTEADVLFILEKYEENKEDEEFKVSTFINEMADHFEKSYSSVENLLKGRSKTYSHLMTDFEFDTLQ